MRVKVILFLLFMLISQKNIFAQNVYGIYSVYTVNYGRVYLKLTKDTFSFYGSSESKAINGQYRKVSDSVFTFSVKGDTGVGTFHFNHSYKELFVSGIPVFISDSLHILSLINFYRLSEFTHDGRMVWQIFAIKILKSGAPGKYELQEFEPDKYENMMRQSMYLLGKKNGKETNYYTQKEILELKQSGEKNINANILYWGACKSRGKWKDDKKSGRWIYFNTYFTKIKIEHYRNGILKREKTPKTKPYPFETD